MTTGNYIKVTVSGLNNKLKIKTIEVLVQDTQYHFKNDIPDLVNILGFDTYFENKRYKRLQ